MSKLTNILFAVAAVAASASAFAGTVHAAPIAAERVTVSLDLRGLNAIEVDRRIEAAARRVCGAPESRAVEAIVRNEACRSEAAGEARERIAGVAGTATVAAIY
jgi:UrcA family protein